jgi:SAM-dependent methyltransferase
VRRLVTRLGHTARVASLDEQRLAFGTVAELYDCARPSYPSAAIDVLIAHAGLASGDRVLEVGAGTGKATILLAQRGLRVLAVEPSPAMAALARINCRAFADAVTVVEAEFERWVATERADALVSAAAWHWIAADVRYERAAAAVRDGGTLAALWTFPDWPACALRGALTDAYDRGAPALAADFPMHPASEPTRLTGDWQAEIAASADFGEARVSLHPWSAHYTSAEYTALLQTHQDHILLDASDRERLLDAIAAVIEHSGGTLTMPFVTRVCLATRRLRAQP